MRELIQHYFWDDKFFRPHPNDYKRCILPDLLPDFFPMGQREKEETRNVDLL